ncbi:flotillin family protein [bacterium]|nr:MAG: flotillin family protein [bacterium]
MLENPQTILIPVGAFIALIIVLGLIATRLYRKASKEISLVRTGLGGQKVILNGGATVLPVFQDVIRVNMNTLRLEVRRNGESGLITKDRLRVDVQAEFFVRVKPTIEAIADAAQTLGQRTMDPNALKELVEGKFVDSLRAVAAEMTMEELHEQRVQFVQRVQTTVSEDILKNGLELESVALTSLDQTSMEFLNPNNAFDAQGLAKLTETIEAKRKQRNDIEQESRILIEKKNLEAEQQSFSIKREQEYARLEQEREISIRRASQAAEISREQAAREQESKAAQISAEQQTAQARIASERLVQEDQIATDRQLKELDVQRTKSLETAQIEKLKSLELAEQDRAIAIAEKSRAKSEAEALASQARGLAVQAEESVITIREREVAERRKAIELVQAAEVAERDAIKITYAAQAEKKASEDRASAVRTGAEAEAEKQKISAAGEAESIRLRSEAEATRYEVEAAGKRALNEADNMVSPEVMAARIKEILIRQLPAIIAESVKPMERIEGIKIVQINGMNTAGGGGSSTPGTVPGGETSMADQMVNSALRYRAQAPLVDALMKEVGLDGADINGLVPSMKG